MYLLVEHLSSLNTVVLRVNTWTYKVFVQWYASTLNWTRVKKENKLNSLVNLSLQLGTQMNGTISSDV